MDGLFADAGSRAAALRESLSSAVVLSEPLRAERAQINVRVPGDESCASEDERNRHR